MAATTQLSLSTQTSEFTVLSSGIHTAANGGSFTATPDIIPSGFVGTSLSTASSTTTSSSINTIPSTPVSSPGNSSVNPAPTSTSDVKNSRSISPLVPATVGSLVGVLVIVICGLLFYLRNRRRRRFQVTPLVNRDEENAVMSQPTQHLVQHEKQALSEAVNESETTPSSLRTPSPQIDSQLRRHLDPENIPTSADDHDASRLQSQMAEMKDTMERMMNRMMEQVQRIEAREASTSRERDLESISSSDGPPPTYVSS